MIGTLLAFAVFAAVVTITPGLDTMLVLRTAAVSGRVAAFAAGAGIGLGCLCWAMASALGITALLTASTVAYDALRWAGAAYLCYLGIRILFNKSTVDPRPVTTGAFRTGLTTNLLNPKVGVFYLSVLPQFLPRGVSPLLASAALGAVHVAEGMLWFALLIAVVARAARWFAQPAVRRRLDRLTALVFLGLGVRLAVGHRVGP